MKLSSILLAATIAACASGVAVAKDKPAAAAAAPVTATATTEDPVVAQIGKTKIHQSDVKAMINRMDERTRQAPIEALFPMVIDRIIDTRLVADQAEKEKLDKDPAVIALIAETRRQALAMSLVNKKIEAAATPDVMKAKYDAYLKANPAQEEVKASHILVENEDDAKAIIAELKAGADFAKLAKEKSKDPSAQQNAGDLGYFAKESMVEPFAKAAFAMEKGALSETPVKTQFGWHVIKVEDKRLAAQPKFEDVQDELRNQIGNEVVDGLVKDLRASGNVVKFQWDGSPVPAADAKEEKTDDAAKDAPKADK